MQQKHKLKGFSLFELLIVLGIVTFLSTFLLGLLGPWIDFKQKLDTERKLMELKTSFKAIYEQNAMHIESNAGATLTLNTGAILNSVPDGAGYCPDKADEFLQVSQYLMDSPESAQKDGYGNSFCIFVSPRQQKPVDNVNLAFHTIALISSGKNGILDTDTTTGLTTGFAADGSLILSGDDSGVLVDGFSVQYEKYKKLLIRLDKIASVYETYFTTRYLMNPGRDVSVDYFASNWDIGGSVPTTNGALSPVRTILGSLGLSDVDAKTPYEEMGTPSAALADNDIFVENYNYDATSLGITVRVRSPASGFSPPYTALIGAKIPGTNSYVVKSVIGNY